MWWKFLILLVLGAPLGHRAWQEAVSQPEGLPRPPDDWPSRKALVTKSGDQKGLAEKEKDPLPPKPLRDVVFNGALLEKPDAAPPSQTFPKLAQALRGHLEEVDEFLRFADAWREVELAPEKVGKVVFKDPKAPYPGWLRSKKEQLEGIKKTETTLKAEAETLCDKVIDALAAHNSDSLSQVKDDVAKLCVKLAAHRVSCAGLTLLLDEAKRKEAEWKDYEELLGIALAADVVKKSMSEEEVVAHLRRHAGILAREQKRAQPASKLSAVVRVEAAQFCKGYLTLEKLQDDDDVHFYRPGARKPRFVKRDELRLVFVAGKKPPDVREDYPRFKDLKQKHDEFNPPKDLRYYTIGLAGEQSREKEPVIEPTKYSRAARYYNKERGKLLQACDATALDTFSKVLDDFLSKNPGEGWELENDYLDHKWKSVEEKKKWLDSDPNFLTYQGLSHLREAMKATFSTGK